MMGVVSFGFCSIILCSLFSPLSCFRLHTVLTSTTSREAIVIRSRFSNHHERMHTFRNKLGTTLRSSRCDQYSELLSKPNFRRNIFWSAIKFVNTIIVASLFAIILRVLNRLKMIRRSVLLDNVMKRPKGRGLLTISNHQSLMDDPGLWSAILPFWRLRPSLNRWSICTEDVFFYNRFIQFISALGNVLPLDRSGSLDQPLFQRFYEKLNTGSWCHVFPEGRIWQSWRFETDEPRLGPFKIGVGKILAHCRNNPIIIPLYHKGMDNIIPEKLPASMKKKTKRTMPPKSIFPRVGQKVEVWIGKPFSLTDKINSFEEKYPGMLASWTSTPETIALYSELTSDIRNEMLKLESEAWNREETVEKE
mmetsp:Transcript_41099/g.41983  ORF Transcript_41099/g.41983 Transcript_41099/m.41983 type:complete len:363 (+) Transcript_41099:50-1138(+)